MFVFAQVTRPTGIKTGYKTFRHIHNKKTRPRDNKRYFNQTQVCHIYISVKEVDKF